MKITTWNVNGIRAALNKGAWDFVQREDPDVLCFQEVKARPEQLAAEHQLLFNAREVFWNPAQKPGYSGVAAFCKVSPQNVEYGIGWDEFDIEGRVIRLEFPQFTLMNVYFPSGQRGMDRVDFKLSFYARLLERCDQFHAAGKSLVICGDFNTAHTEIDLKNPKGNKNTSGFLPQERVWIDKYISHGFVDIYRFLYPEKVEYTWWTYLANARKNNTGWRLDYFMVSEDLIHRISDVHIHTDILGSDHCPVSMTID